MGKLALVPGGVGLGQAPVLMPESEEATTPESADEQVRALAGGSPCGCNEFSGVNQDVYVADQLGIGTTSPAEKVEIRQGNLLFNNDDTTRRDAYMKFVAPTIASGGGWAIFTGFRGTELKYDIGLGYYNRDNLYIAAKAGDLVLGAATGGKWVERMRIDSSSGNVGIGADNPSAALEVKGSATNLFVLKDPPGNKVFRVEKDGDVRADGAYYSGTGGYYTGSADVAERINTSEWVEQGNVVEIDPEHPGFFRKTRSAYNTNVAGVISTSPGVILGNNFDAQSDRWEDNRPMLALAGRVPVKVTAENGPIQVGDLLVSSSNPGYAMRCLNRATCVGATIGKALDTLEEGTGEIMVQVTLR